MGRRNVAVTIETLEELDRLRDDLELLPIEQLRFRPHRNRSTLSRSRVTDEVIERGIKALREEHGL